MKSLLALATIVASSTTSAGVDSLFPHGMPGAEWGTTLVELQKTQPKGFLLPATSGGDRLYSYIVPGPHKELALTSGIRAVDYVFDLDEKLRAVFIFLDGSSPDSVLHGVAELLGEDYTTDDRKNARDYHWKNGATTTAELQIRRLTPSWAYLAIISATDKSIVSILDSCD